MYTNKKKDSNKSRSVISKETANTVLKFRDDRSWLQFHNPKDLAISLSLESAELLEVFQWSGTDIICEEKKDKIREELADILIYCIFMADICDLDIDKIIKEKMRQNSEKYPVKQAYGNKTKYTELRAKGSENGC